jgi:hypothetical protein
MLLAGADRATAYAMKAFSIDEIQNEGQNKGEGEGQRLSHVGS